MVDAQAGGCLVIQPLPGIGDMVWHLPHIHNIAGHERQAVDILTKPRSLADRLLAADPAVREVLWLERKPGRHDGWRGSLRLARELRARRYRRVWLLHSSTRYAMIVWLAGVPERVGFGFGLQRLFLNHNIGLPSDLRRAHPIDKADRLVELAGLPRLESEPRLVLDTQQAQAFAAQYGGLPRPWYAVGIGSSEPAKQWGADRFTQLIERLLADGGSCFVIGGPAESSLARSIVGGLTEGRGRVVEAVTLPIDATAALLSLCDLYVGNDTGVLNLAAAVGVRCVGLFGGSMPLRHSRLIQCLVPESSSAVRREGVGVYAGGEHGMQSISVEQVLAAIRQGGETEHA